ncbi:hypothetical protein A2886_02725 [candidate division WWE3 bacterium RIFCSPHIGHO2_01_FULL_42_13]|uniref:Uncharacterized protein n=1 Tax=candidate division WWE3 bacterium RIFCSPHIGHO2_01_FULL_42_13 TaxID=1802617 RepID=A0A1F4URQ5_UNCKA|nr:MAG: hypothetical protein A2886_02725 [candidate division WWE3 bacterium RIFCSPHIGHO2_01_FULL_42_13]
MSFTPRETRQTEVTLDYFLNRLDKSFGRIEAEIDKLLTRDELNAYMDKFWADYEQVKAEAVIKAALPFKDHA